MCITVVCITVASMVMSDRDYCVCPHRVPVYQHLSCEVIIIMNWSFSGHLLSCGEQGGRICVQHK